MQTYKLGLASLLLLCACDKSADTMQSPAMTTSAATPGMAASGATMTPPSPMMGSMGATGATGATVIGADGGPSMAPTMGTMAPTMGSAPMMNDKPKMAPKPGPSANHM